MRETVDRMFTRFREYLGKLSRKTKIQLAILAAVVVTLAIVATVLLTRTNWVVLPGTGDQDSTSAIHAALHEAGERVLVRGPTVLLVPEQRLGEIQMMLTHDNLMGAPGLDWSILEMASGFGITESHARQLTQAQLGEHIRNLLVRNPRIQNAGVIVHLGETSVFRFRDNLNRPTAAIQLTIADGTTLTQAEAQTIAETVMGAVPGIDYADIRITDTNFNHYPVGDLAQNQDVEFAHRMQLESQLRTQYQTQVLQLLSPIFGMSNLEVQTGVRINFDRRFTEEVVYEPPVPGETEGIPRSMERVHERSRRWAAAEGVPGTDSNAMGSIEYPWGEFDDQDMWFRSVETLNYEINETRRQIEHQLGDIVYTSVSVVVNSEVEGIEEDFSEEMAELIHTAIPLSVGNVTIQAWPFAEDLEAEEWRAQMEAAAAAQRTRELIEMIVMYSVIVLLGVMVFLLGRTIAKALRPEPEPEPMLAAAGAEGVDYIIGDDVEVPVEYEDVDLNAKSPGLEQVERFIDKDPASVAQLLRNWLSDEV